MSAQLGLHDDLEVVSDVGGLAEHDGGEVATRSAQPGVREQPPGLGR
jgi:hypothetical protein